jgi:hypothetical protein
MLFELSVLTSTRTNFPNAIVDRDMSLMPMSESMIFLSDLRQRLGPIKKVCAARHYITVSEVSWPLSSAVSTRTIASNEGRCHNEIRKFSQTSTHTRNRCFFALECSSSTDCRVRKRSDSRFSPAFRAAGTSSGNHP